MTTTRDLVEAQQFARRRLVAAFVSGTPEGRDALPARRGRLIVGSLLLALLLVAGAAAVRVVHAGAPPTLGPRRPDRAVSEHANSTYSEPGSHTPHRMGDP